MRAAPAAVLRNPATAKAAGLAVAMMIANVVSLIFTIVFARLLHASGYGELSSLIYLFLILTVPLSFLQVACARDVAVGRLGEGRALAGTVSTWLRHVLTGIVVISILCALLRHPLESLIGVHREVGAAALIPAGACWMLLSLERGVLQGVGAYRVVGISLVVEQVGRLALGLILVELGGGVSGAFLGTPLTMLATAAGLAIVLRRKLGKPAEGIERETLRELFGGAWAPLLALFCLGILQFIDVPIVHARVGGRAAGAYAAAAVASKVVYWVALGLGFYLVPEAARRASAGRDARRVLLLVLGLAAVVALPCLVLYAFVPAQLLKLGFGAKFTGGADALIYLGLAMTLLASGYLAVQYLLAIRGIAFLVPLIVAAVAEPLVLSGAGPSLTGFAQAVLVVQVLAAIAMLGLALRRRTPTLAGAEG
jgi:O-antigen/teichoic acid export membrane protein